MIFFDRDVKLRNEAKDGMRMTINMLEKMKFSFLNVLIHETVIDQMVFWICLQQSTTCCFALWKTERTDRIFIWIDRKTIDYIDC